MTRTIHDIIEHAKAEERAAQIMYTDAAKNAKQPGSKKLLEEMAQPEAGHERALEALDLTELGELTIHEGHDLRIAEFLADVELEPNADFQTILIFAMKQEQVARDFYKAMTYRCETDEQKKLFELLASQEQQHKLTLETIYDDEVLREN